MPEGGAAPSGLAQRLSDMQQQMASVEFGPHSAAASLHAALAARLGMLADFIDSARRELAATRADDIVGQHLPAASDELDAIVLHTAEATGLILDECETLEAAVKDTAFRSAVTGATAKIYEACSFQDITGQRVAKVVHTLKVIEATVGEMVRVFGTAAPNAATPVRSDALLNGPQRSGLAMEQPAVDALLASFE